MKPSTGNEVIDALIYAAHRVRTSADTRLRACGLSFPGYKLLRELENSDRSMREVSDLLHISPRTVTDMIDGLETRGLVARTPHPSDRRVTLLRLTPAGRGQLADAGAAAEEAHLAAIAGLSAEDRRTLCALLDQVAGMIT